MNQDGNVAVLEISSINRLEIQPQLIKAWLEKFSNNDAKSIEKECASDQKIEINDCTWPWG